MKDQLIGMDERKQILLGIMDEIHEYCVNNDITYFLCGGTLLGSIRHSGFIPWDDDMDIVLLREDYDRLIRDFVSSSGNIRIATYENTNKYFYAYAKAEDRRTVLVEAGAEKVDLGINIDVFPLDMLADDLKQAQCVLKKILVWKNICTLKHLHFAKKRGKKKNIIILFGKVFYAIPDNVIAKIIDLRSKAKSQTSCKYVAACSGAWGLREITKYEYFSQVLKHKFENREYMIPVGYKEYLTDVYGDYMTPPPKEKQITHHEAKAYWR
jgi:lipopolysaccharide cholinephosphotransferase